MGSTKIVFGILGIILVVCILLFGDVLIIEIRNYKIRKQELEDALLDEFCDFEEEEELRRSVDESKFFIRWYFFTILAIIAILVVLCKIVL